MKKKKKKLSEREKSSILKGWQQQLWGQSNSWSVFISIVHSLFSICTILSMHPCPLPPPLLQTLLICRISPTLGRVFCLRIYSFHCFLAFLLAIKRDDDVRFSKYFLHKPPSTFFSSFTLSLSTFLLLHYVPLFRLVNVLVASQSTTRPKCHQQRIVINPVDTSLSSVALSVCRWHVVRAHCIQVRRWYADRVLTKIKQEHNSSSSSRHNPLLSLSLQ